MQSSYNIRSTHILLDCYGPCENNLQTLEAMLRKAAEIGGATVLDMKLHHFSGGGVTGVALLAESHISVHTWPEHNYMAFDIFMCGDCQPASCADYIENCLKPEKVKRTVHMRGTQ